MGKLWILCILAAASVSCVSTKQFNAVRADAMRAESELTAARTRTEEVIERNNRLTEQVERLAADTARLMAEKRDLETKYRKSLGSSSAEATRLLRQIEENQRELDARSAKVEELEYLLRMREEAIVEIRRKVTDALLGFEGKGLTITQRDGNVYVSMDDKLLFRSGSFEIEPRGAEAVRDLAQVLAQNSDINIMVEGHTDDVPYRPNGNLRDNLDLSAKRATTVTRLLLENADIAPERIISAGRGESLPVAKGTTPEARAQNRRTEIILSPKLDELMRLMDK